MLYVFSCSHAFTLFTSAALAKVEFELYLGQSVVNYICISNLHMHICYYSERWPIKFN